MMFWVLIVLAALPLIMGGITFFMLRRGLHHRLHERRAAREAGPASDGAPDAVIIAGWSESSDNRTFSGGEGDFGGAGATGSWESGGGDFGSGGDSGGWSGGDSGGGDSGGGDSGGGGDGGGGGGD